MNKKTQTHVFKKIRSLINHVYYQTLEGKEKLSVIAILTFFLITFMRFYYSFSTQNFYYILSFSISRDIQGLVKLPGDDLPQKIEIKLILMNRSSICLNMRARFVLNNSFSFSPLRNALNYKFVCFIVVFPCRIAYYLCHLPYFCWVVYFAQEWVLVFNR